MTIKVTLTGKNFCVNQALFLVSQCDPLCQKICRTLLVVHSTQKQNWAKTRFPHINPKNKRTISYNPRRLFGTRKPKYIVVIIEAFSKFCLLYPQSTFSAEETKQNFSNFISVFRTPSKMIHVATGQRIGPLMILNHKLPVSI
jgi:hypothetical protein